MITRNLIFCALIFYFPLIIKLNSYWFYQQNVAAKKPYVFRADIIDANGVLLATTIPTKSVYMIPHEVLEKNNIIKDLANILNIDPVKIEQRFESKSKKFVWILRHIAPWQAQEITKLNYSGIYISNDTRRFYPLGSIFGHIVGNVDDVNNGISGVELAFDKRLKLNKKPLKLSLVTAVQFILKDVLDAAREEFSAKSAYGMLICAKTGRILASYSQTKEGDINPHEAKDAVNLNTQEVAERGSIFKVINAAMLLDYKIVDLETEIFAPSELKIWKHTIRDVDKRKHDCVYKFTDAFVKSSNIVHGLLTIKAGAQKQVEFFERVGLFEYMYIDKLKVAKGLFPKTWNVSACVTAAYGHSIATTNAQYIRAILRIINGNDKELHILQNFSQKPEKAIIDQVTSKKMKKLLRAAFINTNYGKRDEIKGYAIGGKTGTANKLINKAYVEKHNLCNYVFIFPSDDPQIIGILSVDEPKATAKTFGFVLASFIAAPLGSKIVKKIGPILGVLKNPE